jgi:protein-S-isoprenylcysteine O-methyltransferase Ste14
MNKKKIKQIVLIILVALVVFGIGELAQALTFRWVWWGWFVYVGTFLFVIFISALCIVAWVFRGESNYLDGIPLK